MKRIINNIKLGLGATALVLCASCTDTWDEHYNPTEGTSATETLWERIKANPNLSRYAALAEKTIYYKDQVHPLTNPKTGKPYTYKDMLSGTQLMTVFAPENDALTEAEVAKWESMLETNPYGVHQQLMANTVSLWRYSVIGEGLDTLQMINGKRLELDKKKGTMQKIAIKQKNIEASNGTLHTLEENLPFKYNLYEYLKDSYNANENSVSRYHAYILDTDTTYFNEYNSIEGNPDANGNPTYVDSAYTNTNQMFFSTKRLTTTNSDKNLTYMESFGANIEGEDSDFVMIVPTDAAWEAAYNRLKPLYKYANYYVDSDKGDSHVDATREITEDMMDSLTDQSINMDIISPTVFNARRQPKRSTSAPLWNTEELIAAGDGEIEYLLNTFGDTLRTDNEWLKTSLWAGKKQIKMSNGIGVMTDNWNFPRKLYQPNLNIEIGWACWYDSQSFSGSTQPYSFSNAVAKAWVDTVGTVSYNNFYELRPTGDGTSIKFLFKLLGTDGENRESEVMSGTYDIGVVCVPDFYKTSSDTIEGDTLCHRITATLYYCNNNSSSKGATNDKKNLTKADNVIYDGLKVDTIWLFKDFTFPYSYKNLRYSWPVLELGTNSSSSERKGTDKNYPGKKFANNLCIDRIIMVAKDPAEAPTE